MRYLITGGSGYIGTRLVERLTRAPDTERVTVADLRPPAAFRPRVRYERLDVTDAGGVRRLFETERPDALVHLAFVLDPIHDEARMYAIDVGGTQNVLAAAAAAGVGQVLVTSSSTAYGAYADNPVPLTEDDPVRGAPDFEYARDKAECDRLCQLWALEHPDRVMTIVRPCIVFGPNVNNFILRLWTRQPFQADLGADPPIQFVHEQDLVDALAVLLAGRCAGAFNVAGDGTMPISECAALIGVPRPRLPLRAFRALARVLWALRLSETPAGQLRFALYPWVVSNEKLKGATGWRPKWSTREVFLETMRSHGRVAAEGGAG